jgi:hypothetical protein
MIFPVTVYPEANDVAVHLQLGHGMVGCSLPSTKKKECIYIHEQFELTELYSDNFNMLQFFLTICSLNTFQ